MTSNLRVLTRFWGEKPKHLCCPTREEPKEPECLFSFSFAAYGLQSHFACCGLTQCSGEQLHGSQPWLRACPLLGRISHQGHGGVLPLTIPAFRTTFNTAPSTHTGSSQHQTLHCTTTPHHHSPRTFHQNVTKHFTSTNGLSPGIPINSRSREAG